MSNQQCPEKVSPEDWAIYQRHLRYEEELAAKRAAQAAASTDRQQSNQFHYVEGDSEAAVAAVTPR